jgi:hypothetical protein
MRVTGTGQMRRRPALNPAKQQRCSPKLGQRGTEPSIDPHHLSSRRNEIIAGYMSEAVAEGLAAFRAAAGSDPEG